MPRYNSNFELDISDIEMIEASLRDRQRDLSTRRSRVAVEGANVEGVGLAEIDRDLDQTADLLGRIHNQKIFYRPKTGAYVSG